MNVKLLNLQREGKTYDWEGSEQGELCCEDLGETWDPSCLQLTEVTSRGSESCAQVSCSEAKQSPLMRAAGFTRLSKARLCPYGLECLSFSVRGPEDTQHTARYRRAGYDEDPTCGDGDGTVDRIAAIVRANCVPQFLHMREQHGQRQRVGGGIAGDASQECMGSCKILLASYLRGDGGDDRAPQSGRICER